MPLITKKPTEFYKQKAEERKKKHKINKEKELEKKKNEMLENRRREIADAVKDLENKNKEYRKIIRIVCITQKLLYLDEQIEQLNEQINRFRTNKTLAIKSKDGLKYEKQSRLQRFLECNKRDAEAERVIYESKIESICNDQFINRELGDEILTTHRFIHNGKEKFILFLVSFDKHYGYRAPPELNFRYIEEEHKRLIDEDNKRAQLRNLYIKDKLETNRRTRRNKYGY